jgi:hypothetical protein
LGNHQGQAAINGDAQIQAKIAENLNQTPRNSPLFTVEGALSVHTTDNVGEKIKRDESTHKRMCTAHKFGD